MNHILKRAFVLLDILANRPETNLDTTTSHSGMRTRGQATASPSSKQSLQTNPKQNLKILEAIFLGVLPKELSLPSLAAMLNEHLVGAPDGIRTHDLRIDSATF